MITRRGSSSSAEASGSTLRRNGRSKKVNPQQDHADNEAVENIDEADSGSQQPVDLLVPVPDQLEEGDSDQIDDSSNLLCD